MRMRERRRTVRADGVRPRRSEVRLRRFRFRRHRERREPVFVSSAERRGRRVAPAAQRRVVQERSLDRVRRWVLRGPGWKDEVCFPWLGGRVGLVEGGDERVGTADSHGEFAADAPGRVHGCIVHRVQLEVAFAVGDHHVGRQWACVARRHERERGERFAEVLGWDERGSVSESE